MIKAVLKNGVICPVDPLPVEWKEGQELMVQEEEPEPDQSPEAIDKWYRELEALAAQIAPGDDVRLQAALEEADKLAKGWVRREMGLAE